MKAARYSLVGPGCVGVLGLLLLLAGCTASWQAPLETRGDPPSRPVVSGPPRPLRGDRYRVARGDTLYSIAWRAGLDYRSLARWNGIRPPYVIYPGQLLKLRPRAAEPRAAANRRANTRPVATRRPESSPPPRKGASVSERRPDRRSDTFASRLRWRWPVRGQVLARWKAGDPLRKGIKIAGRPGMPVHAAEAGKVVYSGSGLIGYGRLIIIKHNENYLSAYGHNRKLLVEQGQWVARGQKIAEMGKSNDGRAMLHFEIRRDGRPVDPLGLLPRR